MDLEGDHIRSHHSSHCRKNHVELGEERRVVHTHRLRFLSKLLLQVEARHQMTVEVGSHTASVLHSDIQNMIVLQRGNGHIVPDVRRRAHVIAQLCRLLRLPSSIIEVLLIPTHSHTLHAVPHLPTVVVDLEGQQRGEHGRHRGHSTRHLTHLEDHRVSIHRQVPAIMIPRRTISPTIAFRIVQLQRVDAMRKTPVGILQLVLHVESRVRGNHWTTRALPCKQLVRSLQRIPVDAGHQRDQTPLAKTWHHRQRYGRRRVATTDLLRRDRVRPLFTQLGRHARDHARVEVEQ